MEHVSAQTPTNTQPTPSCGSQSPPAKSGNATQEKTPTGKDTTTQTALTDEERRQVEQIREDEERQAKENFQEKIRKTKSSVTAFMTTNSKAKEMKKLTPIAIIKLRSFNNIPAKVIEDFVRRNMNGPKAPVIQVKNVKEGFLITATGEDSADAAAKIHGTITGAANFFGSIISWKPYAMSQLLTIRVNELPPRITWELLYKLIFEIAEFPREGLAAGHREHTGRETNGRGKPIPGTDVWSSTLYLYYSFLPEYFIRWILAEGPTAKTLSEGPNPITWSVFRYPATICQPERLCNACNTQHYPHITCEWDKTIEIPILNRVAISPESAKSRLKNTPTHLLEADISPQKKDVGRVSK